ncbi:MAG: hypothetical protein M1832_006159 [Thelocarpon impressellum]|nr:MAG: hypothetical protein M1832_006159 [Thelocarpon impressellum]
MGTLIEAAVMVMEEVEVEEARPGAVRGDRSKTGGVKKPKLTEDELSTRLASIKLKNAAREEAHRRAEADEASFRQREKQEQAKRAEERQNRQVMEGERERNRLRKLKAVGGLEWDSEKQEEDMNARPEAEFPALPQAQAPKAQEPAAAPAAAAAKADPPNLDGANDTGPAAEAESASQAPATAETPAVVPENKGESVPEPSVLSPLGVNTGTWAEQVEAKATESGSGTAPG